MNRLPPSVRQLDDGAPARASARGKPATAHLPPPAASPRRGREPVSVAQDAVETPAKITRFHACDRELSVAAGAPKGFRRIDRLQWLADHGSIADHQLFAGRRLQQDWQMSKIEASPRMEFGGRGSGGHGNISDAALDAGKRVARALGVLPRELRQLTELFLMPEDHPFSLERVAAIVKEDRRAAAYGIRIALSLLARHYGYAT